MKVLFLVLSTLYISACASSNESKVCKKTDWKTYGEQVAMSGLDLKGDDLVKKCKQQKLNMDEIAYDLGYAKGIKDYCTQSNTYDVGLQGGEFNFQICKFENEDEMRLSHSKGVIIYCQSENAYKLGRAGEVFNNICPEKLSRAFKYDYNRGFKKFSWEQITSHRESIEDIRLQQADLRLKQNRMAEKLNSNIKIPSSERRRLAKDVDSTEAEINRLSRKKNNLLQRIKEYEIYLLKLKN